MKRIHLISILLTFCVFFFVGSADSGENGRGVKKSESGIKVTALEFGDKWPFEGITEGYVKCDGMAAIFATNGKKYSLNGLAKSKYNYPYPYEAGIVKKILIVPKNPSLGTINADTEVIRRLCD